MLMHWESLVLTVSHHKENSLTDACVSYMIWVKTGLQIFSVGKHRFKWGLKFPIVVLYCTAGLSLSLEHFCIRIQRAAYISDICGQSYAFQNYPSAWAPHSLPSGLVLNITNIGESFARPLRTEHNNWTHKIEPDSTDDICVSFKRIFTLCSRSC